MSSALAGADKVIIDGNGSAQGVVPYLPLDQMAPVPARRLTPPGNDRCLGSRNQPMKSSAFGGFLAVAGVVLAIILYSTLFVVNQTEYALIFRFGEPKQVELEPGLHTKLPFIDNVVYVDKRILDLNSGNHEVNTNDKQRIVVDWFARYRIADPLKYYQRLTSIPQAETQITQITNSAVFRVLGQASFAQIVRDDRANLMAKIRDEVNRESVDFGIDVVDLRIRRADLPVQNSENVYQQMRSTLKLIATGIRAQGNSMAAAIHAEADRKRAQILGDANGQADNIRGDADAQITKILADAYGRDPEFFRFYRSMQAYSDGLKPGSTRFIGLPGKELFRYLNSPDGTPDPTAKAVPAAGAGNLPAQ